MPTVLFVQGKEELPVAIEGDLRNAGYRLLRAHDSDHALRLGADHAIDVAVIAHGLPDGSGTALALHLKHLRPQVKTIIVAGQAAIDDELANADCVLGLNCGAREVLHAVESLLSRRASGGA